VASKGSVGFFNGAKIIIFGGRHAGQIINEVITFAAKIP
jgi:hypothetical protein